MAIPVIDATVGGENSNSYLTVAEAEDIMDANLYATSWDSATADQKTVSLVMSTRILDEQINWYGFIKDDDQALRWPRRNVKTLDGVWVDDDIIPKFIKDATTELAKQLLAGDRTADSETMGYSRLKVDVLEIELDKYDRSDILPNSVYSIVQPYGDRVNSNTVERN